MAEPIRWSAVSEDAPQHVPSMPLELRARMDALDAVALAAWGGHFEWDVEYHMNSKSWYVYGKDNLTGITLEYPVR